jgi:hypothetical protein
VTGDTPAELILKRLGIAEPGDIDLEAIAWDLGVRIRYRPLDACEARIVGTADKAIITVNSRSPRRRRRFSIGHELGHWHHDRGRILMCQAEEIGRIGAGALSRERAADRFASRLLMPEYILRPVARSYPKADFQAVRTIAGLFDTSITATAIRLTEGGYFPAVLVCHGLRGQKWFTRSPDIPTRWFPSNELSAESFAFGVLYGGKPNDPAPRKIGAEAWFGPWEAERYDVLEQTIRTGEDETLTLIIMTNQLMLQDSSAAITERIR